MNSANLTLSTILEQPSKCKLWQTSSQNSHLQTRIDSPTRPGDGRYRLTDRQPKKGGGVEVVIITPDGEILKYGVRLKFPATNNEAEYKGILTGLRLGRALGAKNLLV